MQSCDTTREYHSWWEVLTSIYHQPKKAVLMEGHHQEPSRPETHKQHLNFRVQPQANFIRQTGYGTGHMAQRWRDWRNQVLPPCSNAGLK
jgi:hypothetical protein